MLCLVPRAHIGALGAELLIRKICVSSYQDGLSKLRRLDVCGRGEGGIKDTEFACSRKARIFNVLIRMLESIYKKKNVSNWIIGVKCCWEHILFFFFSFFFPCLFIWTGLGVYRAVPSEPEAQLQRSVPRGVWWRRIYHLHFSGEETFAHRVVTPIFWWTVAENIFGQMPDVGQIGKRWRDAVRAWGSEDCIVSRNFDCPVIVPNSFALCQNWCDMRARWRFLFLNWGPCKLPEVRFCCCKLHPKINCQDVLRNSFLLLERYTHQNNSVFF